MPAFTKDGKTIEQLMEEAEKARRKAAVRAEGEAVVKRILGKGPKKSATTPKASDKSTAQDAAAIAAHNEYNKKLGQE